MSAKETNILKEMSWKTFKEKKENTDLVIIPSGAFEVYGPHLPLGSDTLVSTKISELVAEQVDSIVGPAIEVGDSAILDVVPGTITIKPESFKLYLIDIVDSLKKWGFRDFLFVNPHLGNVPLINQIAYEMQRDDEIRCAQIDYWRFIKPLDKGVIESGELAHAHASEAGTSILMHLYPELVDTNKWVNEPPKFTNKFPEIIQYHSYDEFSNSGTIGNATLGTAEKGEELVKRSVNRIIQFLEESWGYRANN
ncbi:creatininase family protein [Aquibacillus sediminis]|uniref:creatininase family protein n=1 Tax=Aquibacillus sediminis TaxID=2574734 RepID=UPI001108AA77|nr:creatininase family protein [Aquibacillus sediminis]